MADKPAHFNQRHGYANPGNSTYVCWWSMRQRCEYPKHKSYKRYGGRGISVCPEWHDFKRFLADMGERPVGMTLGRKDNDGPYSPSNCRWETVEEQNHNRSSCRLLVAFGETKNVTQWSGVFGVARSVIDKRLEAGWSVEDAVKRPTRKYVKQ